MTPRPAPPRPFARLIPAALRRLAPLGLTRLPVPPEFAARDGKLRLTARAWRVGPTDGPGVAEVRAVRIAGPACDIANLMAFPADPGRLPVLAAELLAFGGRPRLAFLDLQAPGLAAEHRPAVAAAAAAAGHPDLPRDPRPPDWAVAGSVGGFLLTRTADPAHAPAVAVACLGYVAAWAGLAAGVGPPAPTLAAEAALAEYKAGHVAHTPGRGFLGKLYGQGWADRFLTEFLYA